MGAASSPRESWLATALSALLVGCGCSLGALAGVWMTFPMIGAAVVFLPYAFLFAALIEARPQRWWVYLLASSIGNYFPHRFGGADTAFVLLAEGANYARVLVAVVGMRAFGGSSEALGSLRGMFAFLLFAVGLGPAVGAVFGAAIVPTTDYWLAWEEWYLSNALTALAVLPGLLTLLQAFRRVGGHRRWVPSFESVVVALGLAAVGTAVFAHAEADMRTFPVRAYWPLPFLIWIAVRFTPAATSAALLLVTVLAIGGALLARGPFVADSPTQNLLHMQLFLLALSSPLLLLSDIVQQARDTEKELQQSRQEYRSIVEDQTEMICRFSPDGTYTFVNAAYAAFYGLSSEAFVGRKMQDLLPVDARRPLEDRLVAISRESPLASHDLQVVDAGGERRHQQWRDRGLFDDKGELLQYQCVGRDVTDRRQVEEDRRRLEAQKEVELTLREADRRKDEFLAMLGHELRNPLAPIGLAVQLLREQQPENLASRSAHDLIERQLRHLTRLVDDLLDVARVSRGKIRLDFETIDLRDVVTQGLETAKLAIESRRHEVVVVVPETPLWVRGDNTRLVQIAGNLLHNAAKYTDVGGRIEISARQEADHAIAMVRDNGIGIPEAMLASIFALFTQVPARSGALSGGLGIGLTLVKRLAELHGGSIEARSEGVGRGSEFILTLPLAADVPQIARVEPVTEDNEDDPRLSILVVDDNVDAANVLAAVLAAWGHTTRAVHDGVAALEATSSFKPDVILLDIDMPKIDGCEVARRLRADDSCESTLVALTGLGQQHHAELIKAAGFDHHFVKPVHLQALRSLLRRDGALRASSR